MEFVDRILTIINSLSSSVSEYDELVIGSLMGKTGDTMIFWFF